MSATFALWRLLRERGASSRSDAQRLTTLLAVVAFAVTTAILLVVLGGHGAFSERSAAQPGNDEVENYVILAWLASALLLIPLVTLGGAAARLAVARRDSRLASLRLAGATTGQVATLTVLDAASQALTGALAGVAGYLVLIPVVARLRFQGRTFGLGELWVGLPNLLLAIIGVVAVALVSAVISLRRLAISPLGVANRVTQKRPTWLRLASSVVALIVFTVVAESAGAGLGVLVALLAIGFATLNLAGPFVVSVVGRITARSARSVPTLLAGRRMIADPKTAWRSVGGVTLATFVAGIASATALIDSSIDETTDAAARQFYTDIATGGYLTLGIVALLAAVSTGVMQAGQVIAQRAEYRALAFAGTDTAVLHAARLREIVIPLVAGVAVTTGFVAMFMVPILGSQQVADPGVVLQFLVSVVVAVALVLAGSAASRSVVRDVVRL